MKNQQIFDIFNSSVFDSSVSEFEDEDGRYEIRLYNGGFLSTIGISADVSDAADQRLIDELNRDQAPFRYSMKDGKIQKRRIQGIIPVPSHHEPMHLFLQVVHKVSSS